MAVASVDDVAARVGRPLVDHESEQAEAYLADAEARIVARIPDAVERAATDEAFRANLVSVECAVAIRAARLAEGVDAAIPADGSIAYNPRSQPGYVAVRRSEWRQLGASKGAFYWRG